MSLCVSYRLLYHGTAVACRSYSCTAVGDTARGIIIIGSSHGKFWMRNFYTKRRFAHEMCPTTFLG